VEDNKFLALEHLIFHESEDLESLESLRWNSSNFPALQKLTSRLSLRWKGQWKSKWSKILPELLLARPSLVFEWFFRMPDGQVRRPPWGVDSLGAVAERVVKLGADEVDEFDWVDPDYRQVC
ncbi:hypothetical protein DL93DRAFT_2087489, partial [Clavulina sp. PMI_390]